MEALARVPSEAEPPRVPGRAGHDFVLGGIVCASILMFIGTGGIVVPKVMLAISGIGGGPDNVLAAAMLLNIATIIFGWRRYQDLCAEIEERFRAEERFRELAATDSLTGLLNRRSLNQRAEDMLAAAQPAQRALAYLMLDLDDFKSINDLNGHEAGDSVLAEVARRIGRALPPDAIAARLGGDEFACAFPFDPAQDETVTRIAADLIAAVAMPVAGPACELLVTGSIGIARSDRHGVDPAALMRAADIAMYFSKKRGRNCYTWFEPQMESEVRFRNEIENGIRTGIARGEFVPYYEQQVDLLSGELLGFEMLARWHSPTLGTISPEVFIPIAEQTNRIAELSTALITQAMTEARDWHPSLTLSVNISPVQLRDPWLAQKLMKLLVETGFPANRLEIEITESSLFENLGLAQAIIASLKNQGVRIALDDFGTGYSSLAHLRALPFDRIKIDRSFVRTMTRSSESAAIVETIARLGETMGLPITAEGVEDEGVVEALRELGCLKGQGYLWGRPLDAIALRLMLAERNLLSRDVRIVGAQRDGDAAEERVAAKR